MPGVRLRPGAPGARWVSALFAAGLGLCGCDRPAPLLLQVGHHRIRVQAPAGWQHFDHGRQQLFRLGELQLAIEDAGPAGRDGIERELQAARDLGRAGRQKDCFARVAMVRVPDLLVASARQRRDFWEPWYEVLDEGEGVDSVTVERAFETLLANASRLADPDLEALVADQSAGTPDERRRGLARQEHRRLRGQDWLVTDTWERVTHTDRRRSAWVENAGYLLVVRIERGPLDRTESAFESLLASLEIVPTE